MRRCSISPSRAEARAFLADIDSENLTRQAVKVRENKMMDCLAMYIIKAIRLRPLEPDGIMGRDAKSLLLI